MFLTTYESPLHQEYLSLQHSRIVSLCSEHLVNHVFGRDGKLYLRWSLDLIQW